MKYLTFLPLLALPVLGGIAKREPHYLPICDTPADGQHRLAVPHMLDQCPIGKYAIPGDDMDANVCIRKINTVIKSITPGTKDDEDATYCLLKFSDKSCSCIRDTKKFEFKKGEDPGCVGLEEEGLNNLDVYGSYSWFKTCDAYPDCPEGCYEPRP